MKDTTAKTASRWKRPKRGYVLIDPAMEDEALAALAAWLATHPRPRRKR